MCQARPTADCVLRVAANVAAQAGLSRPCRAHRTARIDDRAQAHVRRDPFRARAVAAHDASRLASSSCSRSPGSRADAPTRWLTSAATSTGSRFVIKQKAGGGFCDWLFRGDASGPHGQCLRPARPRDLRSRGGQEHPVHRRRLGHRRHAVDPRARRPRGLFPRPYRPRLLRRAHPGGRVLSARALRPRRPGAGTAGGDARPVPCAGRRRPRIRNSLISASWRAWWRMSPGRR